MAKATTGYLQALRWLAAAEKAAANSHSLLDIFAAAAMNIDPTLSRRARGRIVDNIGSANSARAIRGSAETSSRPPRSGRCRGRGGRATGKHERYVRGIVLDNHSMFR
jgi:hypothetical protein